MSLRLAVSSYVDALHSWTHVLIALVQNDYSLWLQGFYHYMVQDDEPKGPQAQKKTPLGTRKQKTDAAEKVKENKFPTEILGPIAGHLRPAMEYMGTGLTKTTLKVWNTAIPCFLNVYALAVNHKPHALSNQPLTHQAPVLAA